MGIGQESGWRADVHNLFTLLFLHLNSHFLLQVPDTKPG